MINWPSNYSIRGKSQFKNILHYENIAHFYNTSKQMIGDLLPRISISSAWASYREKVAQGVENQTFQQAFSS